MAPTDEQLMTAYADGDIEAFEILYARHKGRVLGYLLAKLRNRDEAEEVFQAVFAKLHAARDRYREETPLLPWLFAIARNALIDHLRKNQVYRRHVVTTENIGAAAWSDRPACSPPIGNVIAELASLNRTQRQALELRFDQDCSFAEIAGRLQTTSGNARQLVSRAVRHLRRKLVNREGA